MYTIIFEAKTKDTLAKWKKSNPNLFKKLTKILLSIQQDPRHGIGHPEPLVGGQGVVYSRHITARDRIIYEVYDNTISVLVVELEGHYNDK